MSDLLNSFNLDVWLTLFMRIHMDSDLYSICAIRCFDSGLFAFLSETLHKKKTRKSMMSLQNYNFDSIQI